MIGLGPHAMSTADWVLVVALQPALILPAAFAIRLAVRATRIGSGR